MLLHVSGWLLLTLLLSRLLAVQAEEITLVDGVEKRVVLTQTIAPQIMAGILTTAMLTYSIVWWIFPRWFDRGKTPAGIAATGLLAAALLLLESWLFRLLGPTGGATQTLYENGLLIKEEIAGELQLQETVWAFWNLALLMLGAAAAFIWSFARAWQQQQRLNRQEIQQPTFQQGALVSLKSGAEIHQVALDEILFLKKEGNYFEVVTQKKKIVIRQNMETALQWLPADRFCRVHRSYIVALPHVAIFKNNTLMVGAYEVPVGAGYKAAIGSVLLQKAN